MSSYRPMSVAEAGAIIAPKIGLTMSDNRREVVDYLNRYRNLLYNRYEEMRLFDNVFQCFCPQKFHNECTGCNPCNRCYLGFTLPRDMAGIVNVWQWDYPLTLRDSWREGYNGRAPLHGQINDIVEIREGFPTERDLQRPSQLQIYAESGRDHDKNVVIHARNTDGRDVKIEFALRADASVNSAETVSKIHSVVLPSELQGYVTLSDSEGYELSVYSPVEKVPSYKRYKVPGNCRGNILVQGSRQMVEVYFDTDVVEIGDRMVLEFMGTYFKYYESKDQREMVKAEQALARAYQQLDGLVSRDEGGKLPEPRLYAKGRPGLPGYNQYYKRRSVW